MKKKRLRPIKSEGNRLRCDNAKIKKPLKWKIKYKLNKFTKMTYNIRHSLPLSYYETIYIRFTGGILEGNIQPVQKQFYLGNVGTLRGYNVKEFTGNKMALINLEYHVNLIDNLFSLIESIIFVSLEKINTL